MRKLRDRRGITLTEMLCTVLIVLLLTALLVVGIRFAGKTYTESMRLSEAQELCSTLTSVISDKLRFCGTVTQDENGGLTQIFIQNVGSVEGKGDAFQIGEDGQLALGDRHLLGSASYPKGLQVTALPCATMPPPTFSPSPWRSGTASGKPCPGPPSRSSASIAP